MLRLYVGDVLGVKLSPQQAQLGLSCSDLSEGMAGAVESPLLIGLLRPRIVLPTAANSDYADEDLGASKPRLGTVRTNLSRNCFSNCLMRRYRTTP